MVASVAFGQYKRIVIKIGSALLVDEARGTLRRTWLQAIGDDIAELKKMGADVLIVSSGAIALGRRVLGLGTGVLKLEESQAAAAAGQIVLARAWSESLSRHDLNAGQILLTLQDTEERRRYLNARSTVATLLQFGAVPIINENDTVATQEIRYGDNDRLAARVAAMASADLLILLSDVDGLYTAPPNLNPEAQHLSQIDRITPEIEAMAGGEGSGLSRGGMRTKVEAGKIAVAAGATMIIASGKVSHPLSALKNGARATVFGTQGSPATARKRWISSNLTVHGALTLDAGAVKALRSGKSLLPAGVCKITGDFSRGDAVRLLADDGEEIGRGLVAHDWPDAKKIMGRKSDEIEALLGYEGRSVMVHRDDLVITRNK